MKIRMQWKTYNWRTIQEACKPKNQFQVCYQCSRGVTRLDGARGKKQLRRSRFGTWGLSEANVLHWRKQLRYCWDFRRTPQGFGAPIVIRLPGNCALSPSLRPCSAVRESGVDLHDTRGVTRLDGVRGKNQIYRPHIWIWGLMETNLLYLRKRLWHCWKFSAPPEVIRRPHSDFGTEGTAPPLHLLVATLNVIVVFAT